MLKKASLFLFLYFIVQTEVTAKSSITRKDSSAQRSKIPNNGFGMSVGYKNPIGGWGVFYCRRFDEKPFEMKAGVGVRLNWCVSLGVNAKVYDNKKRIALFLSSDYSYSGAGDYNFDNDKGTYREDWQFSACHYLHTYLTGRYYLGLENSSIGAIQLKTGYTFLLNKATTAHGWGEYQNYNEIVRDLNSGALVAIDIVLFLF